MGVGGWVRRRKAELINASRGQPLEEYNSAQKSILQGQVGGRGCEGGNHSTDTVVPLVLM